MRAVVMRKIDNLGRIVLPKELRDHEELEEGTEMDILLDDEGHIILRKSMSHCLFCGATSHIYAINEKALCGRCLNLIKEIRRGEHED